MVPEVLLGCATHPALQHRGVVGDDAVDVRFAIARFEVGADQAATKMLRLGYSDIARIYVNGALLYRGDNSQDSRAPGFLGIVGLHETLAVPLRAGRNEVAFVVEENSGGWGAEAQFADPSGLASSAFEATP